MSLLKRWSSFTPSDNAPEISHSHISMEQSLLRADNILNIVVSPLMMVLSLVGNLLAFLVLSRRSFSSLPMSVYLRFLAVMDVGTVLTGLLPRLILAITGYDVRGTNELSCQCQVYIVYVFTELSSWVLVIVTSERVLSIIKPHKVKILCTKLKSYVIIAIATAAIILANIPIFIFFGGQENTDDTDSDSFVSLNETNGTDVDSYSCGFRDDKTGAKQIWFLTHFIKQSLLPFILIFTLNIIIIVGLLRRRSNLLKSSVDRFKSIGSINVTRKTQTEVHAPAASRKDTSLSVTLVTINIVFLICNFPIGIYQQFVYNFPDRYENSELSLVYSVLVFVLYLNNTLNFFLYSVTGSRFRKELGNMFRCQS